MRFRGAKAVLRLDPTLTAPAHEVDLTAAYTFQAAGVPQGQTVRDEMASLL